MGLPWGLALAYINLTCLMAMLLPFHCQPHGLGGMGLLLEELLSLRSCFRRRAVIICVCVDHSAVACF